MHIKRLIRALIVGLEEFGRIHHKPGKVSLTQVGKVRVYMLNYKLTLPSATDTDVVSWELETTVGTADPSVAPVIDSATVSFNQDDQVSLRVREVDDAGNKSDWSPALAFTASDTLPPSAPGAPVVELVSETP